MFTHADTGCVFPLHEHAGGCTRVSLIRLPDVGCSHRQHGTPGRSFGCPAPTASFLPSILLRCLGSFEVASAVKTMRKATSMGWGPGIQKRCLAVLTVCDNGHFKHVCYPHHHCRPVFCPAPALRSPRLQVLARRRATAVGRVNGVRLARCAL